MPEHYFKLFPDILESWAELTDEECGRLVRALAVYSRTGQPPPMTGNERFLFPVHRAQIDRDMESYANRCEANAENGKKGGRPKSEGKRKNPLGFSKPKQSEKSQDKDKDKDKDEDTPYSPPEGAGFDRFWAIYPKKVGKESARKAFERARKKAPLASLLTAVERQKCSSQWSRDNGQYIPNPATWLNQGRWEDEFPTEDGPAQRPQRRYKTVEINGKLVDMEVEP